MNIQIDKAIKDDVPTIRRIMDAAVAALAERGWYIDDDEDFISRHIEREGYTLKARADGKIIGFLLMRHPGEAEDNLGRFLKGADPAAISHVESMAVVPSFGGQGIITALMCKAEEIERADGRGYLMATAHPDNTPSMRTFQKAGFSVVCQTEMYGGKPRCVLRKELF